MLQTIQISSSHEIISRFSDISRLGRFFPPLQLNYSIKEIFNARPAVQLIMDKRELAVRDRVSRERGREQSNY